MPRHGEASWPGLRNRHGAAGDHCHVGGAVGLLSGWWGYANRASWVAGLAAVVGAVAGFLWNLGMDVLEAGNIGIIQLCSERAPMRLQSFDECRAEQLASVSTVGEYLRLASFVACLAFLVGFGAAWLPARKAPAGQATSAPPVRRWRRLAGAAPANWPRPAPPATTPPDLIGLDLLRTSSGERSRKAYFLTR